MMKFPIRWTTRYSVIEEESNNIYMYTVYSSKNMHIIDTIRYALECCNSKLKNFIFDLSNFS